MSIAEVDMNSDVYMTCLSHAFCTEGEEIMGLLLGHIEGSHKDGKKKSVVESLVVLQRSVCQADRVEISPLQLAAAAGRAEMLTVELGKPIRVLGWYHSHPHITVNPSHIDLRTQANYQAMDPDFLGIIFSVYQHETHQKFAHTSFLCFQAINIDGMLQASEIVSRVIPAANISHHCLQILADIPYTMHNEEKELEKRYCSQQSTDFLLQIQNDAAFTHKTCRLIECCELPFISAVAAYEKSLMKHLEILKEMINEK